MNIFFVQRLATAIACVGMMIPPTAFAETPTFAVPLADVALGEGGQFVGKVVNAQGAPVVDAVVSLRQGELEVANSTTDQQGNFDIEGLQGGLYQVVAENGLVDYRLWAPRTAPPAANTSALIVTGSEILNGQGLDCGDTCGSTVGARRGGGVVAWMQSHPYLVAAGIATAIAVPLAVADDDDPASP